MEPIGVPPCRCPVPLIPAVRRLILTLLYRSGALWLWRLWHRHSVIILTVHGVVDENREHQWRPLRRRLSLQQLDTTLGLVGKHYRFISMASAVDILAGLPAGSDRRPMSSSAVV